MSEPGINHTRRLSPAGVQLLRTLEGVESHAYRDVAGLWTIGVGHLLTDEEQADQAVQCDGVAVPYGEGLSDTQIDALLCQDVRRFEDALADAITVPLTQHQWDALVCWAYNCGVGAMRGSTLLRVLNAGDYDQVPAQLRRWNKAGGRVVRGLENRRERECALWTQGDDETA
jgi:lysozyme